MKKIILLSLCLFSILFLQAQTAIQPVGTGSLTNPYQIDTLPNLYWLSITDNIWGDSLYFIQTSDIDASDTRNWNIVGSDTLGFSPIGENGGSTNPFIGHYDGMSHTISNLYINRPSKYNIGLFGAILNSTIVNLGLINIDVLGLDRIGGLVGYIDGDSTIGASINRCYSIGNIMGYFECGGLIGSNKECPVFNCYSMGTVMGLDALGGLIGYNGIGDLVNNYSYCDVSRCFNYGSNQSYYRNGAGGLIGWNNDGNLYHCWSYGNVTNSNSTYAYSGGLIGHNIYGKIIDSYSLGNVNADNYSGGLIGYNDFGDIKYCYCTGDVNGNYYVGGLIGEINNGTIENSYSLGNVEGYNEVGGLVGESKCGNIDSCFTCSNVSGNSIVGGIVGNLTMTGIVSQSYSTGKIIGNINTGGIVGYNSSEIINSYTTSDVAGGGIVGYNAGTISNCYNTGKSYTVFSNNSGSFNSLYFDLQSSGIPNSNFAYGYLTSEMKNISSFTLWDCDTIWIIRKDTTYPALRNVINNAPFAFVDSIGINGAARLGTVVLANDYDYETLQNQLVHKIISATSNNSVIIGDIIMFNSSANFGDYETVIYRVGELLPIGDTLWGNISKAFIYNNLHTSINENNAQNISIYPNPCINEFTIEGFQGKAKIEIYNINGAKLIETQITSGDKIATNGLKAGTYIVKLISKKENSSQLLIIKH